MYDRPRKELINSIPKFSFDELTIALQKMANLRCEDEHGLVIEIIKIGSLQLQYAILQHSNHCLDEGEVDSDWHITIFKMLPKSGNLCEVANWRPIAILPILYKLFARMVYHRISPTRLAHQSHDQFRFTPGIRIEDALMVAECVIAHSVEFQVPVWLVSLDLRKAFDRVEHRALFEALNRCDLPDCYIALIEQLYSHQRGSANGIDAFQINRGVKQGDVLSSILFNCVLDHAIAKWKLRIGNCGLLVQPVIERLTNSRYADDILVYAKSLNEAIFMMETLVEELAKVGLSLNADKTKILRCLIIRPYCN